MSQHFKSISQKDLRSEKGLKETMKADDGEAVKEDEKKLSRRM